MDPFVTAAIIAGGAALAGGGMTAISGANLNKKNRAWQEKMQRESWAREDALYAQRYSPAAQAQNMRAAGLNPMGEASTMNVGTSSSMPTPATQPLDFSAVGDAGAAIASNLQAREAMKLQKQQLSQQITQSNRQFLLDLKQLNLNEAETNAMVASKLEELNGLKIDNQTKELNRKMLQDFIDAGGNTYSDDSALKQAQTAFQNAQTEYQKLQAEIAKEQSPYQINLLKEQANSYAASACASYANALLSKIQTEYTTSQKEHFDTKSSIDLAIARAARDAGVAEAKIKKWEAERMKIKTGGPDPNNGWSSYINESLKFLFFNFPLVN